MFIGVKTTNAEESSIWYKSPSKEWMGSLPLGNGRIGAMVYGGIYEETIALSEITLWSGQYDSTANDLCGKEHLQEIRNCFFRDDIAKGNELGTKYLSGHGKSFGTNLPLGDLKIDFIHDYNAKICNYKRELNLEKALADVTYNINDVTYSREYFCSNPSQVLVARYNASKKGKLSVRIYLSLLRHNSIKASKDGINFEGDAFFDKFGDGGVLFCGDVKIKVDGGKVTVENNKVIVTGANTITLISDIRTNFNNQDYKLLCKRTLYKACSTDYQTLKKLHIHDFMSLFDRMKIELGESDNSKISTEERWANLKKGNADPSFDALFYQYGRYMLISSSRENSPLPANLQGVWNDNLACNMPWTCDYHFDINIEQNYWSSNIANLAECNIPLFNYLKFLSIYGHETAKKIYGCDGWVTHTINNVWGDTAPGGDVGWGLNVTAGAWMATTLWTNYDFTRDTTYLRKVGYPLLKETAKFFINYMVKDPRTGFLVTGPSISPENAFKMSDESVYCLSMMPTIDRAVVYDIYQSCIKSSRALNIDKDFRELLEEDVKLLPPLIVGKDGMLKEWLLDVTRQEPAHRHASHLTSLYPFGQISPTRTPLLAKACDKFLSYQTGNGAWEDTEWSRGNMINFYARLKDSEKAYKSLFGLYTGFMRENLMTVSPKGVAGAQSDIFSFDATEAAVAGMSEMILQSYDGYLDFLPALPKEWYNGSIKGICARGGIIADIVWNNGKVITAVLYSKTDQAIKCKINGNEVYAKLKANRINKIM